ncbi:RDD family protein [Mucilaginibacter xinganensis]|uniref:RDD domain-containing protein n=1 Tax=Mucilaginibacter xinganensis TaxID=1234841 RepID=A0A223P1L1_9SPHI|nr:RDD family protein [Mucilaginibacter xinganensis]ASU36015.1 hypothetical protein MuYL_4130 [Mucilaginibacter xinganensis]
METITVHTAQNIDIDYEVGGLGERILGLLIDYAIFIPFTILGAISSSYIGSGAGVYFIVLGVIFVFYDLLCETFFNGQSFGKRVMKIRVISLDGARPKFSQYLLRWLFRLVDFGITGGLAALITAALSENGQRIGDMVAGTVLVRTVPRTKMDNLVFKNVDSGYEPVFAQAGQLSDNDISLIHEVIQNFFKTGNSTIVYTLAEKVKAHLAVTVPAQMNNLLFLQTVVKDYSHLTAQADAL